MVKVFDDDFCVDIRIELLKEGKRLDISADYYKNFSELEYNSEKDAYRVEDVVQYITYLDIDENIKAKYEAYEVTQWEISATFVADLKNQEMA